MKFDIALNTRVVVLTEEESRDHGARRVRNPDLRGKQGVVLRYDYNAGQPHRYVVLMDEPYTLVGSNEVNMMRMSNLGLKSIRPVTANEDQMDADILDKICNTKVFGVGDHVIMVNPNSAFFGNEGVVVEVVDNNAYRVKFKNKLAKRTIWLVSGDDIKLSIVVKHNEAKAKRAAKPVAKPVEKPVEKPVVEPEDTGFADVKPDNVYDVFVVMSHQGGNIATFRGLTLAEADKRVSEYTRPAMLNNYTIEVHTVCNVRTFKPTVTLTEM